MRQVFSATFLIFATIVGAGFSSGKEIMIFFSRFGRLSYLFIFIAGFMFFLLISFFLKYGKKVNEILNNSKLLNLIIIFISIVFCSSMFAGIKNLFSYLPSYCSFFLIIFLFSFCVFVTFKGLNEFGKLNSFFMPIATLVFLIVIFYDLTLKKTSIVVSNNACFGFLFCPLYVSLNLSLGGIIVSKVGNPLSTKQRCLTALFSTILIVVFLVFGNLVLQNHSESFTAEMPFLFLSHNNSFVFVLTFIVIFAGCLTTLISLCLTLKLSFNKLLHNDFFSVILSVFVPFLISFFGFSHIVSFLYPFCSAIGVGFLLFLILSVLSQK